MSRRIDQVEKYFKPVEYLNSLSGVLFYISALFAIAIPLLSGRVGETIFQYASIIFVLMVVLHSISQGVSSFYFLQRAERERRKQLLSNSLGVPLTHSQTNNYYNNEREVGLERLSANLMENSFFGKCLCAAILKSERIKVVFYSVLLLFSLLSRDSDLGVVLVLTQTFFAGGIFLGWVELEILRMKNERVYSSLYSLHLNQNGPFNVNESAILLDEFAEYECAKSSASIKLSSKVFHKLNASLTEEWESIKRTVGL
tara:strand:+ start:947 stop:1717 length:771 start_codon:yes stop_codon:yes gene_type:complete